MVPEESQVSHECELGSSRWTVVLSMSSQCFKRSRSAQVPRTIPRGERSLPGTSRLRMNRAYFNQQFLYIPLRCFGIALWQIEPSGGLHHISLAWRWRLARRLDKLINDSRLEPLYLASQLAASGRAHILLP